MFNTLFDNSTLPMLEQVVNFTQMRHGVLAGNIANLDTPGYQARDISPTEFQERLKEAAEKQRTADSTPAYSTYDGQQTQTPARTNEFSKVAKNLKSMLRHDGNNTGIEEQVTAMAKNQQQYNIAITLMNQQFRLLRLAVTERL
jgi:flagellar basal-body rod protein FlgB